MPEYSYDLHIHSCLSPCGDNDMTPANIAGMAFINGLDIIALTDHNSVGNCRALVKAAEQYGLTVLYGMELTTAEEVHVVCLFSNAESADEWNSYVYGKLIKIKNDVMIFGHQYYMSEDDIVLREEENLLINATEIGFESVFKRVESLNGVAFPAHIEKSSYSVLSNLGFIPPNSDFNTVEIKDLSATKKLKNENEYLNNCNIVSNSDAHYLENINLSKNRIILEEESAECLIQTLKTRKVQSQ